MILLESNDGGTERAISLKVELDLVGYLHALNQPHAPYSRRCAPAVDDYVPGRGPKPQACGWRYALQLVGSDLLTRMQEAASINIRITLDMDDHAR
jgi:hypothetical protein